MGETSMHYWCNGINYTIKINNLDFILYLFQKI